MIEKNKEKDSSDRWLKDLPVSNEIQSFKPEEMLVCEKCGRKSPPTRVNCFYCGTALPASELQSQILKPNLRKLESWEKGFNIIFLKRNESLDTAKLAELAHFLEFENTDLQKIIESKKSLPLARVESKIEAEVIAEKLAENNIESRIVGDEQLKLETATRRLRGIEFFDDKLVLILFNNDETAEIKFEDLALIIVGAVFERKIESIESIKRKDQRKILDSSETGTDELLIDIYPQNDFVGYRIASKGFDFSCLGKDKTLLAKENMKQLAEILKTISPNAGYDNDYSQIRAELGKVWEVGEINNAGGVNRKSFGSFRRTNTITISNLSQFTRYSRLQQQIL